MIIQGPYTGLKGVVKEWQVINSDGSIDQQGGGFENLILDQGLDQVANNYFAQLSEYCAVGTGTTTPSQTDTGLVNESARTGNVYNANTGSYDQDGNRIILDPDEHSSGTSNNLAGTLEFRRTFEFPVGTLDSSTDGDYGELGFSPINSSGTNLFSRTLFRDNSDNPITVTVNSDQSLRITYSLFIRPTPDSQTSSSASITNIGTVNFTHMVQQFNRKESYDRQFQCFSYVHSNGTPFPPPSDNGWFEPNAQPETNVLGVRTDDYVFSSYGSSSDNSVGTTVSSVSYSTYTNGNYYKDASLIWEPANFGNNEVATICVAGDRVIYAIVIDGADQFIKADTHRLTLTLRRSWGRA